MIDLLYKVAKVISLDDPDKKGRVQIKILSEMEGIEDDSLPWAYNITAISSANSFEKIAAEVGSLIWIMHDKYYKLFYWLGSYKIQNDVDFQKVQDQIDKVTEAGTNDYKDLTFTLYEDGFLVYHNNSTGEHGMVHKDGSYIHFKADGSITMFSSKILLSDDVEIKGTILLEADSTGNVKIDGGSNPITIKNVVGSMKGLMTDAFSIIQNVVTPGAFSVWGIPAIYINLADTGKAIMNSSIIPTVLGDS
jgi:hypothetical protein